MNKSKQHSAMLRKNFFVILCCDIVLLIAAYYTAHLIRFDFNIPDRFWSLFVRYLPLVILVKIITFYLFDLYKGMWRYTSIADLFNIIKASTASTLLVLAVILFRTRFEGLSRSIFIIDWCLTILFIGGYRLAIRIYFVHLADIHSLSSFFQTLLAILKRRKAESKNLLIIGAGDCGEQIYRQARDNPNFKFNVVAFIDDDRQKIGKKIHGTPVFGPIQELGDIAKNIQAQEILIAIPSASAQQIRTIVHLCEESGIKFRTVPGISELINGEVSINSIRDVAYRDLLGREVINLEQDTIGAYLNEKSILITGAGGSIGSELCRQICRFMPNKIILFERAESPLHAIELELQKLYQDVKFVPILADIQDKNQLVKPFEKHQPDIVFHAAAYKHVPMLEIQPWKAIDNNVIGTKNLIDVAAEYNVARFVFVSTDKAVRPTNVMGASKRLAEMIVQGQNVCGICKTKFMIVRFGNVVGSVGSVVPIFKKQIQAGGPVTVTHPEITRFFMTIPEASQLILQAGAMGKGGEIFILDMGTPVKIDDMARDLIRLSGYEPDVDIKIEYIGLRPGEKLYEELITEGENIIPTRHEKIMILKGIDCDLELIKSKIDELVKLAVTQAGEKIKSTLKDLVPDYKMM